MTAQSDRSLLRRAVGEENFPDLVAVCERLDQMETRLAISSEGIARITRALAEELVAQRLAVDVANEVADTPKPEDPA